MASSLPDRPALVRLVGAVLAEQHGEWTEQRRYLGPGILANGGLRNIAETTTDIKEVTITAITPRPEAPGSHRLLASVVADFLVRSN